MSEFLQKGSAKLLVAGPQLLMGGIENIYCVQNLGMGKTCEPKAFSFQCLTKFTTNKKKKN